MRILGAELRLVAIAQKLLVSHSEQPRLPLHSGDFLFNRCLFSEGLVLEKRVNDSRDAFLVRWSGSKQADSAIIQCGRRRNRRENDEPCQEDDSRHCSPCCKTCRPANGKPFCNLLHDLANPGGQEEAFTALARLSFDNYPESGRRFLETSTRHAPC